LTRNIKLIFKENFQDFKRGYIYEVKPGFWRNFLERKKVAFLTGTPEAKKLRSEITEFRAVEKEKTAKVQQKIASFNNLQLEFKVKAGKGSNLYDQIDREDIAKKLSVEKQWVIMEPIKKIGVYTVTIKHGNQEAQIKVEVKEEKPK
jgi:ribosomal protein L9